MSSADSQLYNQDEGGVLQRLGSMQSGMQRNLEGKLEVGRAVDSMKSALSATDEAKMEEGLGIGNGSAMLFSGTVGLVKKRVMGVAKTKAQSFLKDLMDKAKQAKADAQTPDGADGSGDTPTSTTQVNGAGGQPTATPDPNATTGEPAPNSATPSTTTAPEPSTTTTAPEPSTTTTTTAPESNIVDDNFLPDLDDLITSGTSANTSTVDGQLVGDTKAVLKNLPEAEVTPTQLGGGGDYSTRPQLQPTQPEPTTTTTAPEPTTTTPPSTTTTPPSTNTPPSTTEPTTTGGEPPPTSAPDVIATRVEGAGDDAMTALKSQLGKTFGLDADGAEGLLTKMTAGLDTDELISGASSFLGGLSGSTGGAVLGALSTGAEFLGPLALVGGIGMGVYGEIEQQDQEATEQKNVDKYQGELQTLSNSQSLQTGSIAMPTMDTNQFRTGGMMNF